MTALEVAAAWVIFAVLGAGMTRWRRKSRREAVIPLLGGLVTLLATTGEGVGAVGTSSDWQLSRMAVGVLALGGVGLALAMLLAPAAPRNLGVTAGLAGAASVLALASGNPLWWAASIALACFILGVRWMAVHSGRGALRAGRMCVLGSAVLIAAAPFQPVGLNARPAWNFLVGALIAGGVAVLLGLFPVGGWLVGAFRQLPAIELAPWATFLVPVCLLGAIQFSMGLSATAALPLSRFLVVGGLAAAIWNGFRSFREPSDSRWARIFLADIGLAATGIGTATAVGRAGALVLVASYLVIGPLLSQPSRRGLTTCRTMTWLSLVGLPPTATFWGRFFVLEGCAATSQSALIAAAIAAILVAGGVINAMRTPPEEGELSTTAPLRAIAWVVPCAAALVGIFPSIALQVAFGYHS